jgi:hypothetical protein
LALYIAIAVAVLFALLLIIIATRPNSFRIERSAVIGAAPNAVFPLINDFHEWVKWSPWEGIDPNLQRTYEGAASGPGAKYHWVGNKQVGEGRMTILESKPGEFVTIKLEFLKPFAATNQANFKFTPSGAGTQVTWSMEGKNNFMMKGFSLLMNMDKMVGKDFEKGLANLNAAVQGKKG